MKTIREFFLPLVIRWREYTQCAWCFEDARIRCKEHRVSLCGNPNCIHVHRYFHGKAAREASDSLLKPAPCVFKATNTWLDHCIHAAAVFVTAVGFIWFFVLMGVI